MFLFSPKTNVIGQMDMGLEAATLGGIHKHLQDSVVCLR